MLNSSNEVGPEGNLALRDRAFNSLLDAAEWHSLRVWGSDAVPPDMRLIFMRLQKILRSSLFSAPLSTIRVQGTS